VGKVYALLSHSSLNTLCLINCTLRLYLALFAFINIVMLNYQFMSINCLFITSLLIWVQSIVISVSVCLSVCLSACIYIYWLESARSVCV